MSAPRTLPALDPGSSPTGCCALIDPNEWDGKTFSFIDKPFAVVRTHSIFHVPVDMASVMRRTQARIDQADARAADALVLSHDVSPWRALHYVAVTGEVPGMDVVRMSGRFLTKVFDGPYRQTREWEQQLREYALARGEVPVHTYFFYTACPRCAETFGSNYVVGFARVA